jgi:hypothetical protein
LHLFLIPLERASGDSQMIFVHAKHTPFAAGAKRRDRAKKFIRFQKNREWDAALRRVGSALVAARKRMQDARRAGALSDARATCAWHMRVTLAAPRVRLACAPEKWNPAFRSGHAQPKNRARIPIQSHRDAL